MPPNYLFIYLLSLLGSDWVSHVTIRWQ